MTAPDEPSADTRGTATTRRSRLLIRFREYIIVFAVAASPLGSPPLSSGPGAKRHSLMVMPDERRVHERPTPTAGGAAMYFGMLVAIATASQMPAFAPVFKGSSAPIGVVFAATIIFGVGMADDVREMSPPAKLAGQVLAGTVLYFFGVDMLFFHVPLAQTTVVLSPDPRGADDRPVGGCYGELGQFH